MRSRVHFVDLSEVSKHAAAQSLIYPDPPRSSLVPVDTCFTCSCAWYTGICTLHCWNAGLNLPHGIHKRPSFPLLRCPRRTTPTMLRSEWQQRYLVTTSHRYGRTRRSFCSVSPLTGGASCCPSPFPIFRHMSER
jgi:hypothetical protein